MLKILRVGAKTVSNRVASNLANRKELQGAAQSETLLEVEGSRTGSYAGRRPSWLWPGHFSLRVAGVSQADWRTSGAPVIPD